MSTITIKKIKSPLNSNLDAALDSFHRANTSKNIIRLEIFETLYQYTSNPFLPGDLVIADKIASINPRLNTRFYLIAKDNHKGFFFANITEHRDYFSVLAEHESESININKDQLFEVVNVYEVLYYERFL